jgi:hypothetical protein
MTFGSGHAEAIREVGYYPFKNDARPECGGELAMLKASPSWTMGRCPADLSTYVKSANVALKL